MHVDLLTFQRERKKEAFEFGIDMKTSTQQQWTKKRQCKSEWAHIGQ